MMKVPACTLAAVALATTGATCTAFVPPSNTAMTSVAVRSIQQQQRTTTAVFMSDTEEATTDSAFVADVDVDEAEKAFDAVEKMGRGAAKTKRGKRKGGGASSAAASSSAKSSAKLEPEFTHYEGPPAITETLAPTLSIVTVVGIVPAAAAWARQAWVRYSITSRRVRVTSGIGGKDMAEIVYPDVVEMRTVKRLFGDGDIVFFLRDGAKFEMRNVPNFDETMEFICGRVDKDVADMWKNKGDVGKDM